MDKQNLLDLVRSIYERVTDDEFISARLDEIEGAYPNGDVCDLIFQDMRNLTPEEVVEEAMRRQRIFDQES